MIRTIFALILAAILLAVPRARASGVTAFAVGASSGTSFVILSTTPQSFWGIDVSSAAAGDLFKCYNSTSSSGLTIASAATLVGEQASASTSAEPEPQQTPISASNGVVCAKSSTSSEMVVYISAP